MALKQSYWDDTKNLFCIIAQWSQKIFSIRNKYSALAHTWKPLHSREDTGGQKNETSLQGRRNPGSTASAGEPSFDRGCWFVRVVLSPRTLSKCVWGGKLICVNQKSRGWPLGGEWQEPQEEANWGREGSPGHFRQGLYVRWSLRSSMWWWCFCLIFKSLKL